MLLGNYIPSEIELIKRMTTEEFYMFKEAKYLESERKREQQEQQINGSKRRH